MPASAASTRAQASSCFAFNISHRADFSSLRITGSGVPTLRLINQASLMSAVSCPRGILIRSSLKERHLEASASIFLPLIDFVSRLNRPCRALESEPAQTPTRWRPGCLPESGDRVVIWTQVCRHEAYADVAIAGGAIQRKSGLYSRSKAPASGAADAAPSRLGASRWKMRSSERAQWRQQRNAPYCQPKGMT